MNCNIFFHSISYVFIRLIVSLTAHKLFSRARFFFFFCFCANKSKPICSFCRELDNRKDRKDKGLGEEILGGARRTAGVEQLGNKFPQNTRVFIIFHLSPNSYGVHRTQRTELSLRGFWVSLLLGVRPKPCRFDILRSNWNKPREGADSLTCSQEGCRMRVAATQTP